MSDTTPSTATDTSSEAARSYRDAMRRFERQMAEVDADTQSISRRTTVIIRVVVGLTILSTLYLGYTVFVLGGDAKRLAGSMVEMYQHLGTMATDVDDMTGSVESMGARMREMPAIGDSVRSMSATLTRINGNVGKMDESMEGLDRETASIGRDMRLINGEMARMTHSVDYMRHNVGEMARPLP